MEYSSADGLCPACLLGQGFQSQHDAVATLNEPGNDDAGSFLKTVGPAESVSSVGDRVGRYKLLQPIGEGGFGTVYMAEQEHPVRRRVALKIIKLGMDTKAVIARFEAERQALAMMDHPNIARVFDAGATDTGRPYFVMELVNGIPITEYCNTNKLTMRQRLELFLPVCHAIQHAHTKGIIHRDIKPTNVLTTMHDDIAVPKVIDFGVAKAMHQRLTEKTLFTEFRQMIGTPQYMSPEQAQMSGLDIDTRSDIYSLGVLLYELLTGTTPLDAKQLRTAAYDQMQKMIQEEEPPTPSTRLSTLGSTLPTIAAERRSDPSKLSRLVKGEVDWIVMKALEKNRTRRYDTASAMARDIEHYLADEPVEACPPSARYRMEKFIRHYRLQVIVATSVLVLAATTIAIYVRGVRKEQQKTAAALVLADQQRDEANKQQQRAAAVSNFLTSILASADPRNVMGNNVTVLQATQAAVQRLDAGALTNQPLVEADVREAIGTTMDHLIQEKDAEINLRKSLELRQRYLPETDPIISRTKEELARALTRMNKDAEAEKIVEGMMAQNPHAGPEDELAEAKNLNRLATSLQDQGKIFECEAAARKALEIRQRLLPANDPLIGTSLNKMGDAYRDEDKLALAESYFRQALTLRRQILPDGHPDLAKSLRHLCTTLDAENKLAEAEPLAREALAMYQKSEPAGSADIISAQIDLAMILDDQRRLPEAEKTFRDAVETARSSQSHSLSGALARLAQMLMEQGRYTEAEPLVRESIAAKEDFSFVRGIDLTTLLMQTGRISEAEATARETLKKARASFTADRPALAFEINNLCNVLCHEGKAAEAEPLARESLEILQKGRLPGNVYTVYTLCELAKVLDQEKNDTEAEQSARQALDMARADTDHPWFGLVLNAMVGVLLDQSKYTDAEPLAREALEQNQHDWHPWELMNSRSAVVTILTEEAKYAEAETIARENLKAAQADASVPSNFLLAPTCELERVLRAEGKITEADALAADAQKIWKTIPGLLQIPNPASSPARSWWWDTHP
jgi:serine/threonine protein kinase